MAASCYDSHMRVAVAGSGIAGLAAARELVSAGAHVTMFEAASRPGGHVYTVEAHGHAIDMGFIFCNRELYPNFYNLLNKLNITTHQTTISFSIITNTHK